MGTAGSQKCPIVKLLFKAQRQNGFLAPLLLAAAALLFAACGGTSASSPTGTSAGQTKTSGQTKALAASVAAYRNCLAKHGLKLPSFSGRRSGLAGSSGLKRHRSGSFTSGGFFSSGSKYKAAFTACASLRPKTGLRGFPGGLGGFPSSAQNTAFRDCLKVNGLSRADLRSPTGKTVSISPKKRKLIAACLSLVHKSSVSPTTTVKGS